MQQKSYVLNASKPVMFVNGTWQWKGHAFIDISVQHTVSYEHVMKKIDGLEPRSTALLLQRNRIFYNMAYAPIYHQEAYFKAMITREPVLQPEPDGGASFEFLVTNTGACNPRDSLSSEAADMLINDLGLGVKRGDHDIEATDELLTWKAEYKTSSVC